MHDKYNAVIFQSSFHHCLHFDDLIKVIRSNVLAEGGRIYFFCEPIYKNYTFPWGLRHDGESIWAITCNHWLELGFDWNFFFKLMLRNGLFLSRIEPFPPFVGEGWIGDRGVNGLEFEDWCLPEQYDSTFYPAASTPGFGRFCRESSILPGLRNCYFSSYELQFHNYGVQDLDVWIYFSSYELQFHNYEVQDLDVSIYTDRHPIQVTVPPGGPQSIRIEAACGQVFIKSSNSCS